MDETGCAGVVVGRGCLGRPWLFADLAAAFNGDGHRQLPRLFEVREIMYRHGGLIVNYFDSEERGCRDLRKHMAWYLKGFKVPSELRRQFGMVSTLQELRMLLDQLIDQPYPVVVGENPRGRTSHGRPVTLPAGWLNDPEEWAEIEYEDAYSGG
jgi:tRNA-dihydrouridine synthase